MSATSQQETPLHYAAKAGHLPVCKVLLDAGAQNLEDATGKFESAPHYSTPQRCRYYHSYHRHQNLLSNCILILPTFYLTIDLLYCYEGVTPLDYARKSGFKPIVMTIEEKLFASSV